MLISSLFQDSNTSTNIQYDQYGNAKHVLKSIETQHHHCITEELTFQGMIIYSKTCLAQHYQPLVKCAKICPKYLQPHIEILVNHPCNSENPL